MKKRLQQMEEETLAMQSGIVDGGNASNSDGSTLQFNHAVADSPITPGDGSAMDPSSIPSTGAVDDGTAESDARSVYVGNVSS